MSLLLKSLRSLVVTCNLSLQTLYVSSILASSVLGLGRRTFLFTRQSSRLGLCSRRNRCISSSSRIGGLHHLLLRILRSLVIRSSNLLVLLDLGPLDGSLGREGKSSFLFLSGLLLILDLLRLSLGLSLLLARHLSLLAANAILLVGKLSLLLLDRGLSSGNGSLPLCDLGVQATLLALGIL